MEKEKNKNRGLKNRTPFSSTLDNNLYQKLQLINKETKVPISKLLDEAIELLIKKREH
ncbi:ribbon-helix-helix domain-containing protein [Ureibacillus sp. FSL W8-0352]|uniref:ribbon-helix-helix domain-containing protein n=1 Tax=Ureibacillus sp. FSL W8-0352 TaxID=2954596 RepID=UPI0030F965B8